ncbi:hypothetical protein LOK74_16585 [Brevibacillus humidisoli]|uniref:hypothetical protein n=1 Tax=Brevibacillus humidisoli TaxID=2895522 RepID=UPI001E314D83|nr:hypothetical protein [Brevibacillus humidisoli]UFJ39661.1 hypothetical protein LOK74_16585 [Brevibacillus humidisoli]
MTTNRHHNEAGEAQVRQSDQNRGPAQSEIGQFLQEAKEDLRQGALMNQQREEKKE